MASPIQQLLDTIKDGVLILNQKGEARFANPALRLAFPSDWSAMGKLPQVQQALEEAKNKAIALPAHLTCHVGPEFPSPKQVLCTLIEAPNQTDYALIVHHEQTAEGYHNALSNFIELVRSDLSKPMTGFIEAVESLLALGEKTPVWSDSLVLGQNVMSKMSKLLDLVDVFGGAQLESDERVLLKDLITEVWVQLAPVAKEYRVLASLVGFSKDLPPIYGSKSWLFRAFYECLENAVKHSSKAEKTSGQPNQIEIKSQNRGQYLTVTISNVGVGILPNIQDRMFLPLNQAGLPSERRREGLSIGLPMAHRILEMHGGHLRIESSEGEFTECVIELPTGAPKKSSKELDIQQAQRYAEDLAKLIARNHAKKRSTAE